MREKLLLLVVAVAFGSTARLQVLPAFTTVITRITNNTIDVLQGVTGVVQGGLNMVSSTINRIIDGAGTVRDKISQLLEEFRKYMERGIPELGIPILEPLNIDRIEVNISSPKIGKLQGYAANVEVRRLSEFKVDYVNWDIRNRLSLNVTFPRIDVKGRYAVNGEVANMVKIYGKGPFWLKVTGVRLGTITKVRYNLHHNPPYYVEDMKIAIKFKKLNNNFSNLMNGTELGKIFNQVIANVTPEALDMLWPELEPGVSRQVTRIINEKLKTFQLSTLLGRLLNFFTIQQR